MTTYYDGNAMRRSGYGIDDGVFYLLQDHLKSSSSFVNQSGATLANNYYYPYGGNRGGAFSNLTTKRFTSQYHESSLPGGEELSYYNARWYDPKLGGFLSADTIIPDPTAPQNYNRYSYVLNNPLKYTDPTGHIVWVTAAIGAAIGGTVTGATYLYTAPEWDIYAFGTVFGAGAVAGGLIGSGIGAAAGTVQMSATLAMASSAAVASGSGAIATAEAYMVINYAYDQPFDKSDFAISTGTAAVEGAVNSLIPGSGLAVGASRAAVSTAFGAADYLGRNAANGVSNESTVADAAKAGLLWGAGSATGDLFAGGFQQANPLRLRIPVTSKDWAPTIWLNGSLNGPLMWKGAAQMGNEAVRPTARNSSILWAWAVMDKEANK